jgi:hypothetical protein
MAQRKVRTSDQFLVREINLSVMTTRLHQHVYAAYAVLAVMCCRKPTLSKNIMDTSDTRSARFRVVPDENNRSHLPGAAYPIQPSFPFSGLTSAKMLKYYRQNERS